MDTMLDKINARRAVKGKPEIPERFAGVTLTRARVEFGREGGAVAGAHAVVETAGDIARRLTATRIAALGPFALALKKKKDQQGAVPDCRGRRLRLRRQGRSK